MRTELAEVPDQVIGIAEVARRLQEFVESARNGSGLPVAQGEDGDAQAHHYAGLDSQQPLS